MSFTAAAEFHRAAPETAVAFFDAQMGPPAEWPSPILRYQFSSEFQEDLKAERGHWLLTAHRLGFLDELTKKLIEAKRRSRSTVSEVNDNRYKHFFSWFAPAMAAHYLDGTGWSSMRWEPWRGGSVDIDLRATSPNDRDANFQVKGSGRLTSVAPSAEDEHDEDVLAAIDKAMGQLPTDDVDANIVVMTANRTRPLSHHAQPVVTHLLGHTSGDSNIHLPYNNRGKFFQTEWKHVSAVLLLDFVRGANVQAYSGTVLTNPQARNPIAANWFPRASVLRLVGSTFRWSGGEPGNTHTIPDGTTLDPAP